MGGGAVICWNEDWSLSLKRRKAAVSLPFPVRFKAAVNLFTKRKECYGYQDE